jgi:hypothetical protein
MTGNLGLSDFTSTALLRRFCNLLLFVFLCLPASGSYAHDTSRDGDGGNDWIGGLANAENVPCCGHNDCYPIQTGSLQISDDGVFRVEIRGRWFSVPEPSLLRDRSPDGRPWVCPKQESAAGGYMYIVRGVRCLLLPMGS